MKVDELDRLANQLLPFILRKSSQAATQVLYVSRGGGGGPGTGGGVTDHSDLTGLDEDDHAAVYFNTLRGDARYALKTRTIISGAGLSGGGDLSADRTLTIGEGTLINVTADAVGVANGSAQYQIPMTGASPFTPTYTALSSLAGNGIGFVLGKFEVGEGNGLTVGVDDISLTLPGTLSVSSSNSSSGNHKHAITSSPDPDDTRSLLSTSTEGLLILRNIALRQAAQSNDIFASGFAGSGWRVDYGITTIGKASAEFDDLTVRGRMRVYELLIQQIRATNGSVFVSSASKVVSFTTSLNPVWTVNGVQLTLNGSNATLSTRIYTIKTRVEPDGGDKAGDLDRSLYHGFLEGDLIRAQQVNWNGSSYDFVMQSNLEVTKVTDLYTYQATFVGGNTPAEGYDYVRLGNSIDSSRQGAIYLTSDDSAAPFIDIVDGVRSFSDWNSAGVARVRVGKLTGISDTAFGGPLSGYGLYGNNVYLRGQIIVTGGNAATTNYVDQGLSSKAGTAYVDAISSLKADLTYVDTELANAVAPLAAITYVDDRVTHIDGGSITTGTINANRISAVNLAVLQAAVANLAALNANMGTVTAGSIVIGSINKLWLNDSNDGSLAIGGSTKIVAPFRVSAAGHLDATDATFGDLNIGSEGVYISALSSYSLETSGYKFRYGAVIGGGLTINYSAGIASTLFLDNNTVSSVGTPKISGVSATTSIRASSSTSSNVKIMAMATGEIGSAKVELTCSGASQTIAIQGTALTFNGYTIWHSGNGGSGSGLNADLLDNNDSSYFAPKTNPIFPESIRLTSLPAGGSSIASSGIASIYLTADKKLVIAYWDGTSTKYRWMNLNGTSASWFYQLEGSAPS